jgi:Flp pilus assembly protein TadD
VRAPGLTPGQAADGRLRQLFPTLLALAGLPAATGAEAQPLAALPPPASPAFDYARVYRELAARHPPGGHAERAAERDSAELSATAAAAEAMAKLQALGYIGAGEATRASAAAVAAGGPDATRTASSWNNEGIVLRGEERPAEARAAFERAIGLEPELASALWNLSDLLLASGDRERSDEMLVRAVASGLPDGIRIVIGRAIARERAGRLPESLALLDRALLVAPETAELWLFRGRYRVQSGDCAQALPDLVRAAELAPGESDVFATTALAHLCVGDRGAATTALRRALALAPEEPRLQALLAELQSVD